MALNDTTQSREVPFGGKIIYVHEDAAPDPSLYYLSPDEATFFKATTGINDDEELKAHILMAQEKAYKVAPYPWIRWFGFLRMGISKHSVYGDIVKIGRERKDAVFLDIGCCFATDARKVAADGFPSTPFPTTVTDIMKSEFLELSHVLFRTSKETWPAHFIPGDALDPEMLSVVPPARGPKQEPLPDLTSLTSLNALHGHCSVINASAFFHLFDEEQQLHLARALAGLLSHEPGSIICGIQTGKKEKGITTRVSQGAQYDLFSHSPESWKEMWNGMVFEKGEVQVRAERKEFMFAEHKIEHLYWSITRL
ncbi:hypothetical protein J3A83DRAFT_4371831 [Scleroderma citrinum]